MVYVVALKAIALLAGRRSTDSVEDYYLARRGVGTVGLAGTTMASAFSSGLVIGIPSQMYARGVEAFWGFFFVLVPAAILLFGTPFWKLGKDHGFITSSQMLGEMYGSAAVRAVAAVAGFVAVGPYAIAQLVACGKTFTTLTDGFISYGGAVWITAAVIGIYVLIGGARAVIWTDVVQGTLLAILIGLTACLSVTWAGGWERMMDNLAEHEPEKASFGDVSLVYFDWLLISLAMPLLPYMWQRLFMAKSPQIIRGMGVGLPCVFAALFLSTWIIGVAAMGLFPDGLADSDNVMAAMFTEHAPYLGAVLVVATIAAAMSTIDTQLLSATSIVTIDILPLVTRTEEQHADHRKDRILGARVWTVVLLVAASTMATILEDWSVVRLIRTGMTVSVIFLPVAVVLLGRRRLAPGAAVASMVCGFACVVVFLFTEVGSPFGLGPAAASFLAAAGVLVGVDRSASLARRVRARRR